MDKSDEAADRRSNVHFMSCRRKGTVGALLDVLATWREEWVAPVTGRALD